LQNNPAQYILYAFAFDYGMYAQRVHAVFFACAVPHSYCHLNRAIVLMKAAVSRTGNALSKIMGHPCWEAHGFRGCRGSTDGSTVRTQNRSVQVLTK
jgi:hypothetical protein